MPITRPIVRSITRAITRSITGTDVVQRFFPDYKIAAAQHADLGSGFTPAGDFSGSYDVELKSGISATETLLSGGNLSTDTLVLEIDATNVSFFAYVGGVLQTAVTVANPKDDKLNTINFSYTGTTASLDLNGGTASTATWALDGNQGISFVNRRGGGTAYSDGIKANFLFNDASTLVGDYPMDEPGTDNVMINRAAVLGSELYSFGNVGVVVEGSVSQVATGFDYTGGTGVNRSYVDITTLASDGLFNVSIENLPGSMSIFFRDGVNGAGNVLDSMNITSDEAINRIIPAGTQTILFEGTGGSTSYDVRDVSIKQVPVVTPYGTYVNMDETDRTDRVFDGTVSPNTWTNVNPPFDVLEVAGT